MLWGGNSYYKENNDKVFPPNNFIIKETITLDTLVAQNEYSMPDLIKMDIQGAELDALKGATNVLKYCKYLILELQEIDYNRNAPKALEVVEYLKSIGYICCAHKFSDNGADYDSCFINTKLVELII